MNLVLLGAPGAGKGTQAQLLVEEFGLDHISTGDLLRNAVKENTALGQVAKEYMDAGELVPDSVVIDLVKERLASNETAAGFILDGFPRNTAQAVTLDSELASLGLKLDAALLVSVEPHIIVERLSGRRVCKTCGYTGSVADEVCPRDGGQMYQRDDDKPATIEGRLKVYDQKTAPLIEYYKGHGILVEVDGEREPSRVYEDVKVSLNL